MVRKANPEVENTSSTIANENGDQYPKAAEAKPTVENVNDVSTSTTPLCTQRQVGLINDRVTFDGFFSLILEITCRDLNLAIPWVALQTFNYNESIELEVL